MKKIKRAGTWKTYIHWPMAIAALALWVLSFFTDRLLFTYSLIPQAGYKGVGRLAFMAYTWALKFGYLAVLFMALQGVWRLFRRAQSEEKVRRMLLHAAFYFVLMFACLLIVWPGLWRGDEFTIFEAARGLNLQFWHHYLTSLYYIFSMMLLPFPTGILIVQLIMISLIVGYAVSALEARIGKLSWLLYIPLIFPAMIDNNNYIFRTVPYAYLELLFVVMAIERLKDERVGAGFWWGTSVLIALLGVWRSEGIYYLALGTAFIAFLYRKKVGKAWAAKLVLLPLALALALNAPQLIGLGLKGEDHSYELTAFTAQAAPLVQRAQAEGETELVQAIDRVLDKDILIRSLEEGNPFITIFTYDDLEREGYSDFDFTQFRSALMTLYLKYPDTLMKERLHCFLTASGMNPEVNGTARPYALFEDGGGEDQARVQSFKASSPLVNPPFPALRSPFIKFIDGRAQADPDRSTAIYRVFWNLIPPVAGLFIAILLMALRHRKWACAGALTLVAIKFPLVFMTSPVPYFKYYFPLYLIGYLAVFGYIAWRIHARRGERPC